MGKELFDKYPAARRVFEAANEALGFDLTRYCFEGPLPELTRSAICQPAIVTVSIAAWEALKQGIPALPLPAACAGLSLGEYAALVACDSINFRDAVCLVHKRGAFMDEASQQNPGTMSCILGLEESQVDEVCRNTGAEIANLNCPGQVVISGTNSAIAQTNEKLQAVGAKRVIPLEVSGPFHCSLMKPAADKLKVELAKITINAPKVGFLSNVSGDYASTPSQINAYLCEQVDHTTKWWKSIEAMQRQNIRIFYEIGPGKVLRGLLQRIDKSLEVFNVEKAADIEQLIKGREERNEPKG